MFLLKLFLFYFVFIGFMAMLTEHEPTKKPAISSELSEVSCGNKKPNINVSNEIIKP